MYRRALACALALSLAVVGTACGDDDETTGSDDAAETETDTEAEADTETDSEAEQASGDFCSAYQELLAGDPTPDAIRDVAEIAPEDGKQPLEDLAAGFEADDEGFFGTPEFDEAFAEIGAVANAECADSTVDVTTVEYAFEGMPEQVEAGVVGVNLTNEGQEFHEMVVFRKADGVTQSFDEIFSVDDPEELDESLVEELGGGFVSPGGTSGSLFDLSEPGDYIAVCFVPTGTTDLESEPAESAQPHYAQGMQVQFTVG